MKWVACSVIDEVATRAGMGFLARNGKDKKGDQT
jgi:hypothetical protein